MVKLAEIVRVQFEQISYRRLLLWCGADKFNLHGWASSDLDSTKDLNVAKTESGSA